MEKILTDDEVLMVKKTNLVRPYKSETEGFKGKNYRIYAFGKDAFSVHEDDDFHTDLANGNVAKIMLDITDEGASLLNHITWTKANAQKRNKVINDSITVENYKPTGVTLEDLVGAA